MSDQNFSGSVGVDGHIRVGQAPNQVILSPSASGVLQVGASSSTLTPLASIASLARSGANPYYAPVQNPRACAFETFSRMTPVAATTITGGRRNLTFFTADDTQTLSNLELWTGAGTISGLTAARMGLYTVAANGDCTLVAQTANDSTIGAAASTQYARALDTTGGFPGSYTTIRGQRYASAFYIAGTTVPTIVGISLLITAFAATAPRVTGFDGGSGTDLNTTILSGNVSLLNAAFYMAGV